MASYWLKKMMQVQQVLPDIQLEKNMYFQRDTVNTKRIYITINDCFVCHSVNFSSSFEDIKLKFSVQISINLRKVLNYFAAKSEETRLLSIYITIEDFLHCFVIP